jgi:hypothetical protein
VEVEAVLRQQPVMVVNLAQVVMVVSGAVLVQGRLIEEVEVADVTGEDLLEHQVGQE